MKTRTIVLIAILLSFANLLLAQNFEKNLSTTESTFESDSGQTVHADVGTLKVSENRSNPNAKFIDIHFVRLKSTNPKPSTPIFYLEGGPGVSSSWQAEYPNYLENWLPYLTLGDVILLDQKGTGEGRDRVFFSWQKDIPKNIFAQDKVYENHFETMYQAAFDEFKKRGVDIAGYNTRESTKDLDGLRQALGYDKISFLGFSYGSHLGQAYLKYYSEFVEHAILVGVEGLDHTLKLPLSMDTQFRRIALMAQGDPAVNKAVPDLLALYKRVVQKLEKEPAIVDVFSPINGMPISLEVGALGLNFILRIDLGDANDIPVFPRLLHQIDEGNYEMLRWFIQKRIGMFTGLNGMGTAMDLASGASPIRLQQIKEEEQKSLFKDIINFKRKPNPKYDLGDEFRAPLHCNTRTLFMSGSLDFNTPPYQAEEVRWGFSNSSHIIVDNAGHEQILRHPDATAAIIRFLKGEAVNEVALFYPPIEFIPVSEEPGEKSHPSIRKSLAISLYKTLQEKELNLAITHFNKIKDKPNYYLNEREMNSIGYAFFQKDEIDKTVAVFKLNVAAFPDSWNAYDSLGEAYMTKGEKELAIQNYEKSVLLNPLNNYGIEALKKLKEE